MGIPLLAGRLFNQHDNSSAPTVTIISEAMARVYFPNQDPLGKHLFFGFGPSGGGAMRKIVGVVGDVHDVSLGKNPGPIMYVPYAQAPFWGANLVVRSTLSTASVAAAIRQEVQKIDKDLPVTDVANMPDLVDASVAQPRFRTFLLGLFAAMALVLAATGIFGVISYSVSRRTNEIGIRVALGASRSAILRMVLRETLVLTFAGMALGIPLPSCPLASSPTCFSPFRPTIPQRSPSSVSCLPLLLASPVTSRPAALCRLTPWSLYDTNKTDHRISDFSLLGFTSSLTHSSVAGSSYVPLTTSTKVLSSRRIIRLLCAITKFSSELFLYLSSSAPGTLP